jgi:lipid-binding SYLF domain-containing protein
VRSTQPFILSEIVKLNSKLSPRSTAARGAGVAVNSKTKQETFMKMISAGAGLGIGVKDYRVIFVLENDGALSNFLDSGWSGSAQTDAAAKVGTAGGAYSGAVEVAAGVWVYQITKMALPSS